MPSLQSKLRNVSNGIKYITGILQKYKENQLILNEDLEELLELLAFHPTKHINKENVECLMMKRRPPYNTLALHYQYKNNEIIDDVSYRLCVKNLFGKYDKDISYKEDVLKAFRNETFTPLRKCNYISNTKIENGERVGKCKRCNVETTQINMDHYDKTYQEILDIFMKNENIILSDIEIYENKRNQLHIKDEELAKKWIQFHDKEVSYRLLCKKCNLSMGSYGYKNN